MERHGKYSAGTYLSEAVQERAPKETVGPSQPARPKPARLADRLKLEGHGVRVRVRLQPRRKGKQTRRLCPLQSVAALPKRIFIDLRALGIGQDAGVRAQR